MEHGEEKEVSRNKSSGLLPVHGLHVPPVVSATLKLQRRRRINICSDIVEGRLLQLLAGNNLFMLKGNAVICSFNSVSNKRKLSALHIDPKKIKQ